MKLEWDETKRQSNLRKHHLDFADVEIVFSGSTFIFEDDREYEEDRYNMIGLLRGKVVVITYTEREDIIRVISMRKATKNEQRLYFKNFTN